jgi:putative transposase
VPKISDTSTPETLPRAYASRIAPEINGGKQMALEAMNSEWQLTLPLAFDWYWNGFLRDGKFRSDVAVAGPKSVFPKTKLVTSQKDLMLRAIVGQAASWTSNLKNRIRNAVMSCGIDDALRHQVLWINSMKAWLLPYREQLALLQSQSKKKSTLSGLSPGASRIMRKMVRNYLGRKRLPNPSFLPLQVNVNSAVLATAINSKSTWAQSWLRISTLERGKKIELPVMANPYADKYKGEIAQTYTLIKDHVGQWSMRKIQRREVQKWEAHKVDRLAIDLGLRNLLSTNYGDIYGAGFIDKLARYDKQLISLQKGLQAAGEYLLKNCRRYRVLVQRIRGFLKTEIQTSLKRLLDMRRPKVVVIERLLFAGQQGNLSRRMNRLMRRFGQQFFTKTLDELQAFYGFTVEEVDPAYTSQECNSCGFVHRGNRDGDRFKCLACGHVAHADVNAAKNHHGRSVLKSATQQRMIGKARWMKALVSWIAATQRSINETSPCLSRKYRAVGSSRAGLKVILSRKDSASRLNSAIKKQMHVCCSESSNSLSKGLMGLMELLTQAKPHSTI